MFQKFSCSGALLACALLAFPAMGRAQGQVTLSQAVESAWSRAVEAAESAGQSRRAGAALAGAQAPWAASPSMEVGQWRDRTAQGRTRETEAALVIPLWLPGQRAARIGAATAESANAEAALQAAKLRVAGQVREAQWNVHAQEAELAAQEAQLRTVTELARDVERRVAAGDLARTDALAASADQLAAQAAVLAARQKVAAARSQWRALTGLDQVPPGEPQGAPVPAMVPDAHPDLKAARTAVHWAQGRLDAARLSRRDPPELAIGARHETVPAGGPDVRGVGVSLRIPFATPGRNQPIEAAALSELELAQARERKTQLELASQLEVAAGELDAARRSLSDEERRAALLRERYVLLERSYRSGNTSLPELLRTLAAASQADADVERRKVALGHANARVQQVLGVLP